MPTQTARARIWPRCLPASVWLAWCVALSSCGHAPIRPPVTASTTPALEWHGRFALTQDSEPAQSFSASFELTGSVRQGDLRVFSPIGTVVHHLRWDDTQAELLDTSPQQRFDNLSELIRATLGVELPIEAFFDWLCGLPTAAPGWRVEINPDQPGKIKAVRSNPAPQTELRVILHTF